MSAAAPVDITEALAALADDDLRYAIMTSDHPAAKRMARWLCHECLPAAMRGGQMRSTR